MAGGMRNSQAGSPDFGSHFVFGHGAASCRCRCGPAAAPAEMRGRRREKSGPRGGIYYFHLFFPLGTIISRLRRRRNVKHGVAGAGKEGAGARPDDIRWGFLGFVVSVSHRLARDVESFTRS